ncbi:MAG: hypothetical protein JRG67_14770 [Deltaproteobacteria bacterium]|nr:hypothetical protein [Deltaproteobacteria bacterium]MBW2212272.1 hypothetical protein [Deltaproteobacteria bacterium]MBW2380796.1 hypothetical protein [Deltaproteobacteria bacterium]MBW2551836.1 hypothetical protein [Deltaproteobacteria bacterium]MBW2629880.1 hypothetical protein [Deltaproteobacteria bacterium]
MRRSTRPSLARIGKKSQPRVEKIAALASVDAPKAVPLAAAKFLSMLQTLRYKLGGNAPKISSTAIAVMSAGQFLDGSKAERELGFKAEVSLDEALRRALEWFRRVGYVKTESRVVSDPRLRAQSAPGVAEAQKVRCLHVECARKHANPRWHTGCSCCPAWR